MRRWALADDTEHRCTEFDRIQVGRTFRYRCRGCGRMRGARELRLIKHGIRVHEEEGSKQ